MTTTTGLVDLEEFFADPEFAVPTISPDGTRIAYLAPAHGRRNVWVRGIDQDHSEAVCVTHDSRRGITTYHWTDDPRFMLYLQDTDGNEDWHLHRVDLDGAVGDGAEPAVDLTPLAPGSRVIGVDAYPPVPGTVLVWMNQRPLFFDTFRIDVATGETTLHREQEAPGDTVLLDRDGRPMFSTSLTADGTVAISAIDPATGDRRLVVHGGPWYHDAWGYSPDAQFLANRGYAVLQVNFRGSLGYGRRHVTAAIGEFARAMHDDLIDATAWAVDRGYADPDRIGVYGGSYGGYAALIGVTVTPGHFAAAVDYVGVSDLATFLRTLPPFGRAYFAANWYRYVGNPADPAQEADMRARSPITMVDRIRTPLLVAQGANDVRVPQEQSDTIVASLRSRGVPVEYLVAEDEGHGFDNPGNRIRLYRAIERHFAEHLGGRRAG
jgi:acetyl esterase/lipase